MLTCVSHSTDRRLARIHLTDHGRRLREDTTDVGALSDRAMSGVTHDERTSLVAMLHKIRTNLA